MRWLILLLLMAPALAAPKKAPRIDIKVDRPSVPMVEFDSQGRGAPPTDSAPEELPELRSDELPDQMSIQSRGPWWCSPEPGGSQYGYFGAGGYYGSPWAPGYHGLGGYGPYGGYGGYRGYGGYGGGYGQYGGYRVGR